MTNVAPRSLSVAQFALWCTVNQGAAAYQVYLTSAEQLDATLAELSDELTANGIMVGVTALPSAPQLLQQFVPFDGTRIIDARHFQTRDWALLDRQRSQLLSNGCVVFVMSSPVFDDLMGVAPNLASWLGGDVFIQPSVADLRQQDSSARDRRLVALRAWAKMTDLEVIEQAEARPLPRDPEFGEWLVLLGRGELLRE